MARSKEHFCFSQLADGSGLVRKRVKTVVIVQFVSLSSPASSKVAFTDGIVSLVFY